MNIKDTSYDLTCMTPIKIHIQILNFQFSLNKVARIIVKGLGIQLSYSVLEAFGPPSLLSPEWVCCWQCWCLRRGLNWWRHFLTLVSCLGQRKSTTRQIESFRRNYFSEICEDFKFKEPGIQNNWTLLYSLLNYKMNDRLEILPEWIFMLADLLNYFLSCLVGLERQKLQKLASGWNMAGPFRKKRHHQRDSLKRSHRHVAGLSLKDFQPKLFFFPPDKRRIGSN